jgi:hypothetical protein
LEKGAHADSETGRGKAHNQKFRLLSFQKIVFAPWIRTKKNNHRLVTTRVEAGKSIKTATEELLGWL